MKIKIEFNFWLWLCRYSYRRMKVSIEKLPVGIPGMRDPDNTCAGYTPRKRLLLDVAADCETDGHYLCKECAFNREKGWIKLSEGLPADIGYVEIKEFMQLYSISAKYDKETKHWTGTNGKIINAADIEKWRKCND
jgi:hypothetical protein